MLFLVIYVNDVISMNMKMKLVSEKILLACEVIGLLIAKINILKQQQITCYEWQPLKQLLKVKSLQHIEI